MDFLSNLIKRPISLVLNETSTTVDKYPISASLPNTPSALENKKKDLVTSTNGKENNEMNSNNKQRSLSMSSSCNSDNMTDFIGVPEEILEEFKDILPPPPFPLHNSDSLTQSILDMDISRSSISLTPPPLPFALPSESDDQTLTPSMRASQTIDELLSHINDNLQLAGLNDDVLAIALPTTKSETTTPLSSKTSLNKLASSSSASNVQSSKAAAGSANSTSVCENNFSLNKHTDPVLDHKIGVNKLSNKFVGLTEFDEEKIPELPGNLNPNIEEQYNVTFEKCFVPTLNAHQGTTVEKTQLFLTSEAEAISSDNETFADCNDEKDPLYATFAEPTSLEVTTDQDSYKSTFNKTISSDFNNTMDNIADLTMEADGHSLRNVNQTLMVGTSQTEQEEPHLEIMIDESEPMDIDMNETIEIIHNTSNNIQNVEKVLQHAENILQHLEDQKPFENVNTEELFEDQKPLEKVNTEEHFESQNPFEKNTEELTSLLEKQQTGPYKTGSAENVGNDSQHLVTEHSSQEISWNKSIEVPINKDKSVNSECTDENSPIDDMYQETSNELEQTKNESANNLNSTNDGFNSSSISNSSAKSANYGKVENKINLSLSLSNSSTNSQKSSPPSSSSSFPIKSPQSGGFPRSPKAVAGKPTKSTFLEKSDYLAKIEAEDNEQLSSFDNANQTFDKRSCEPIADHFNGLAEDHTKKQRFSFLDGIAKEPDTTDMEFKNQQPTISTDNQDDDKYAKEKRRTFSVIPNKNERVSATLMQFPSIDKTEDDKRRTFSVTDTEKLSNETVLGTSKIDLKPRHTFILPSEECTPQSTEESNLHASFEAMEIDDSMSQSTNTPVPTDEPQTLQAHSLQSMQQNSALQQRSKSPSLEPVQQSNAQSSTSSPPSPPLPVKPPKSQSPLEPPTVQPKPQSPTLPTMQTISLSPPLPAQQSKSQPFPPVPSMTENNSEILATFSKSSSQAANNIKDGQISPPTFESTSSTFSSQSLSSLIQKRPPIRDARARAADILSAKEQSNIKVKDEKDIFVEKNTPSPIEEIFTAASATSTTLTNSSGFSETDQISSSCSSMVNTEQHTKPEQFDDEFSGSNNLILNPSDFDYLLTKGNNNTPVDRSSLLLKFDPLLGVPVPVNLGQQQQQRQQFKIPTNINNPCLSPTLEEDEHNVSNRLFVIDTQSGASAKILKERSAEVKQQLLLEQQVQQNKRQITQGTNKKNATMSVDVIKDMSLDNDCNKTFENSNSTQSDDKQINYKMDELEKKIKNEVLKTEDIEKKLKDAEQREEALIKRITEKDKTIAKMTGVIEAYEKAIAELIAEREQLTQHYEKQLADVKADRDSNYHHLTSLETTFSDLHVKYEKSKEMTCQLKENEEALLGEKRQNLENLHLQEQRYDKMKNHAMQQLEIANKKLESQTREHSIEITKLKALLKKEEIARSSINEQLAHKTKENAELVKICDELITGQGSNFSFEPFDSKKH